MLGVCIHCWERHRVLGALIGCKLSPDGLGGLLNHIRDS